MRPVYQYEVDAEVHKLKVELEKQTSKTATELTAAIDGTNEQVSELAGIVTKLVEGHNVVVERLSALEKVALAGASKTARKWFNKEVERIKSEYQ